MESEMVNINRCQQDISLGKNIQYGWVELKKIGKWEELDEEFEDYKQVTYIKWNIQYERQEECYMEKLKQRIMRNLGKQNMMIDNKIMIYINKSNEINECLTFLLLKLEQFKDGLMISRCELMIIQVCIKGSLDLIFNLALTQIYYSQINKDKKF
ncbi:unnamed protein product [Paramecium sonneborni]|uniref:Uncharacterized protein n=1 Tax=Paramecium sonneborni TaxID=65129 RepID=A0A8S1Q017_9CILI|nr:unnamed protein product [Paramecium sonneborni]